MIKQTYDFLVALDAGIRPQCTITAQVDLNALRLDFRHYCRKTRNTYAVQQVITRESMIHIDPYALLTGVINSVNEKLKLMKNEEVKP